MDGLGDNIISSRLKVGDLTTKEYSDLLIQNQMELWRKFTPELAVFVSSGQNDKNQTDAYIDDSLEGYYQELLEFAKAETTIPNPTELTATPKTARMRPVADIRNLSKYEECFITKITFRCFDSTLNNADGLAAGQDANILTELQTSITTTFNDAYMQSRFIHGEIGGYLLNFFRPYIYTPNRAIYSSQLITNYPDATTRTKDNLGDRTVGIYLPYEYEPPYPISIGKISNTQDDIVVYAMAGQIVYDGATLKVQRYPVTCQIEIIGMK